MRIGGRDIEVIEADNTLVDKEVGGQRPNLEATLLACR